MTPLTLFDVLYFSVFYFAFLFSLGKAFRILLQHLLREKSLEYSLVESISLDLAVGTALTLLLVLLLTFFGRLLSPLSVYGIFVSSLLVVLFDGIRRRRTLYITLLDEALPLFLVFLALLLRLVPSLGLYVHGGDDPKLYSLVTMRILEEGGYTQSWGSYALPDWNIATDSHLFMEGFEALAASFQLLTGLAVPKVVLLSSMLYSGLVPLSLYSLAKHLYGDNRVAAFAALLIGLISPTPLLFAEWGGHGELVAGYFLLPTVLTLMLAFLRREWSRQSFVLASILAAGMMMNQVLSAAYLWAFLLPILLYKSLKSDLLPLILCTASFAAAVLLTAPVYVPALLESLSSSKTLPPGIFGWGAAEEYTFLKGTDLLGSILNLPMLFAHLWSPAITLLGLAGLLFSLKEKRSQGLSLIAWGALLFLINENNPFGLYLVTFPLWHLLYPERLALIMVLPLSLLGGYGLRQLTRTLPNKFRSMPKKLWLTLILLLLVPDALYRVIQMSQVPARASPVTQQDMEAFLWIRDNVPVDSLILVSNADAGQWIPVFTGRRVFPLEVVMNNPEKVAAGRSLTQLLLLNASDPEVRDIVEDADVRYVYIGAKTIFNRQKFNYDALLGTGLFRAVYSDGANLSVSSVIILEVLQP
jgi:hypothetical protein